MDTTDHIVVSIIGVALAAAIAGAVWAGCQDAADQKAGKIKPLGNDVQIVSGGVGHSVDVFHDDRRKVTCWLSGHGLSCLPDSMVAP